MDKAVLKMVSVISDHANLNPKHEIPAFAEAASRRQAKLKTVSND
jgi:hypothetical protein